jgi:hypothetical protein
MEKTILIFDRKGDLGALLVKQLATDYLCVLVSGNFREKKENVIHVPLTKKIPVLPKCLYGAFFLVYNGDRSALSLLPAFLEKAKEDNAHIYFIVTVREADEALLNEVLLLTSRVSILLLGDIFGMQPEWQNPVTQILSLAKSGRITLDNSGLSRIYPVEIGDAVTVICRAVRHKGIPGHRIIYLLPPHPVTELSFARLLHNKEPLLKIEIYSSLEKQALDYEPHNYVSVFGQSYSYVGKLPQVVIQPAKQITRQSRKNKLKIKLPENRRLYLLIFILIMMILGLPLLASLIGVNFLYRTSRFIINGDLQKAQSSSAAAERFFVLADNTSAGLNMLSSLGLGRIVDKTIVNIKTGESLSKAGVSGINGALSLKKVFLGESLDPGRDFLSGTQNVRDSLLQVSELQAEGKIPQSFQRNLNQLDKISNLTSATLDVLPQLIGMNGKKSYLVLFQNNMELRPGGGFIGSYATLDIEKGKNYGLYN